jgi:hypothetical protein
MQPDTKGLPVPSWIIERMMIIAVFAAMVLGGMGLIAVMLRGRQRMRELAIQQRIAMIEKGLVPSPETDPVRFETLVGLRRPVSRTAARYRSAGVFIIGFGCAMFVLLCFAAGIPEVAFGVGGGIVIIGAAALINGLVSGDDISDGNNA